MQRGFFPLLFLIAGRNRLEAVIQLGLESVPAIEIPFGPPDGDTAALAEIAENLHRRGITALERAELYARWVEIVSERDQARSQLAEIEKEAVAEPNAIDEAELISGQVGRKSNHKNPKGAGRKEGGIEKVARDNGVSATNLKRSVRISSLSDEAKAAARDAGLDGNQSALLRAAKEPTPDGQVQEIERQIAEKAEANRG